MYVVLYVCAAPVQKNGYGEHWSWNYLSINQSLWPKQEGSNSIRARVSTSRRRDLFSREVTLVCCRWLTLAFALPINLNYLRAWASFIVWIFKVQHLIIVQIFQYVFKLNDLLSCSRLVKIWWEIMCSTPRMGIVTMCSSPRAAQVHVEVHLLLFRHFSLVMCCWFIRM